MQTLIISIKTHAYVNLKDKIAHGSLCVFQFKKTTVQVCLNHNTIYICLSIFSLCLTDAPREGKENNLIRYRVESSQLLQLYPHSS